MDQHNGGWRPNPEPAVGRGVGDSTKRARERVETGLPVDYPPNSSQVPPQMNTSPQRPYRNPMPGPQPVHPRAPGQPPQALLTKKNAGPGAGVAIPRTSPGPQWPLGNVGPPMAQSVVDNRQHPAYRIPSSRGIPPQRPLRPGQVRPGPNANVQQRSDPRGNAQDVPSQNIPSIVQPRQNQNVGTSQNPSSPLNPASRPSTISSIGSVPDFPIPFLTPQQASRRSAPLGPPPSARRGASSYYSNASFVSPILEEDSRAQGSHGSYASSAAIPSTWESDSSAFNFYDGDDAEVSDDDVIEEDRESRESNLDDDGDEKGLVRSASIGRRGRPSMITTRSSDKLKDLVSLKHASSEYPDSVTSAGAVTIPSDITSPAGLRPSPSTLQPAARNTLWPTTGDTTSTLGDEKGPVNPSTSSSETIPTVARIRPTDASSSMTPSKLDQDIRKILNAHEAASNLKAATPSEPGRSFSRLSAIRRPPRLNIDAVREAEARGSLTSLSDLIKRATRLAALMEIGKRPGSRLDDLNGFPTEEDLARGEKEGYRRKVRRGSSLSNMLNAFPPPGWTTPTIRDSNSRPPSAWPSGMGDYSKSHLSQQAGFSNKPRKCCGLPFWAFLILLIGLLCIIAAAIVLPIELLVVHGNRAKTAASTSDLASCQSSLKCENGGINSLSSGSCSCICVNGFTGTTCTVAGNSACTTMNISGTNETWSNVTVGEAIPRLVQHAEKNFSIPLSGSVVLARFNSANLTCESENALVTFDGMAESISKDSTAASPTTAATRTTNIARRDRAAATWTEESYSVATSILHADPTIGASTPSVTATSKTKFVVTEEAIDFGRAAVLYVLQQEEVNNAITAQAKIQNFFSVTADTSVASNVSLGNGNVINFVDRTINLGEGNVGGTGTSKASKRWERG